MTKMKFLLGELDGRLTKLDTLDDCVMPAKLGCAVARNKDSLVHEFQFYDREKEKLIERYALRDEKGDLIFEDLQDGRRRYGVSAEDKPRFEKELRDLNNEEVDIDIKTVPFSLVESLEDDDRYTNLTAQNISAMSFMIVDDEPEETEPEENA